MHPHDSINSCQTVFVYGTLRPPREKKHEPSCHFYWRISPYVLDSDAARLENAELYRFDRFPAVFPGTGVVHGEVLRVKPTGLSMMDEIEGHPSFFVRKQHTVATPQGQRVAWVYWGPHILRGQGQSIGSGDWLEALSQDV